LSPNNTGVGSADLPPVIPAAGGRENGRIAVLVGAVLSAALVRSGFFAFLFLVPLGCVAAAYTVQTARRAFAGAAALNILAALGLGFFFKIPLTVLLPDALYYTVMFLVFLWIMAPPERGPRIRTAYRLIAGALAGSAVFLSIEYTVVHITGVSPIFRSQAELLSSLFISSAGGDAARYSYFTQHLTAERLTELLRLGALRGGALASSLVLFFLSRQMSQSLARVIRRGRPLRSAGGGLRGFFVPRHTIWALSFSLAGVLGSRLLGLSAAETAAWNALIVCAMLFLAQGGGIVLYLIGRRAMPPVLRLFLGVLAAALVFSPGINAMALGVLILLGIAENWVPFRAPKSDGSSSTPGG
jgi:hypothetical protein